MFEIGRENSLPGKYVSRIPVQAVSIKPHRLKIDFQTVHKIRICLQDFFLHNDNGCPAYINARACSFKKIAGDFQKIRIYRIRIGVLLFIRQMNEFRIFFVRKARSQQNLKRPFLRIGHSGIVIVRKSAVYIRNGHDIRKSAVFPIRSRGKTDRRTLFRIFGAYKIRNGPDNTRILRPKSKDIFMRRFSAAAIVRSVFRFHAVDFKVFVADFKDSDAERINEKRYLFRYFISAKDPRR